MQTHASRLFLTLIGKLDNPMVAHLRTPDYDQCLRHTSCVQPGERVQLHQVLNHRPKLNHILQINRLQKDGDTLRHGTTFSDSDYEPKVEYLQFRF